MNLPMRQDKKRNQALDAFASIAKTWSEWRLGERAAQSVATGTKKASKAAAKARKRAGKSDSGLKKALKSTPVRIAGAAALVGGVGAAVAKKLKGGGTAEPLYTPPTGAPLQDIPSPPSTGVVVGDLAAGDSAVASSEKAVAAASGSAGDADSAVAASEQAVADATPPPPSGTEPTVPDTDPEPAADTTVDDEVEDAMDAHSDSAPDAASGPDAANEPATTAGADADELEPAAAGDAHGDDAPTVPADDDKS
jgi:hypothetical protein